MAILLPLLLSLPGGPSILLEALWGPCYWSLLGVVCDVISNAAAEDEEAIGWMFPSSGASERSERSPRWMETSIHWLPLPRQKHRWWRRTWHQEGINSKGPNKGSIARATLLTDSALCRTRIHMSRKYCLHVVLEKTKSKTMGKGETKNESNFG